jgi:tRNA(His) 5'-end guanylyltransferase
MDLEKDLEKLEKHNSIPLGDRMKQYEEKYNYFIPAYESFIVKLDGWNFSTFTEPMEKPFDDCFVKAMGLTSIDLLNEFSPRTTYCHSDEITMIFAKIYEKEEYINLLAKNDKKMNTHMNGGRVQKIVSHTAGFCSVRFAFHLNKIISESGKKYSENFIDNINRASFDARVMTFDGKDYEIANHQVWRSKYDCERNAVSTFALQHFSSSQLHLKSTEERIKMLNTVGIKWPNISLYLKYGIYCKKELVTIVKYKGDNNNDCKETYTRCITVLKSFKITSGSENATNLFLAKYWNSAHGYNLNESIDMTAYIKN